MFRMGSHCSFEHLKHKLWPKEGPGVKLAVWLPTTKSLESTSSWCPIIECNTALESSRRGLELFFKPHCDRTLQSGDMSSQSSGTPTRDNFETPTRKSREKEPFGCSIRQELRSILQGGRWWLPPSPSRGESCVSVLPVAHPSTKGALVMH
jgi:hypothetical protein